MHIYHSQTKLSQEEEDTNNVIFIKEAEVSGEKSFLYALLTDELMQIKLENKALEKELGIENEEDLKERHKEYLDLLHEYNDLKDVGQALLGQLAILNECTTRELYDRYDLKIEN